jgi:hypothetical protein
MSFCLAIKYPRGKCLMMGCGMLGAAIKGKTYLKLQLLMK